MKKILLAAVAALAFVGCTQNEEIEKLGDKAEIKVGTVVRSGTRAAVTTDDNFKNFTVYAYTANTEDITTTGKGLGNAYMNGIAYSKSDAGWTTTGGTFYWPLNKVMQFFAYPSPTTPVVTTYQAPEVGYPHFSFAVAAKAEDQTDLVVANETVNARPSDNKLLLTFKHILTRINFSYKPEDTNYTYTITGIKINSVSGGTAKYTFDTTAGVWDVTGATSTDYTYPIEMGSTADKDGFLALDKSDGSLMLLPQSVADKTIEITYKTERGGYIYFDDTKTVTLPTGSTWGIGQNIRYKLTLPVGAEAISIDTKVSDWDNEVENVYPKESSPAK